MGARLLPRDCAAAPQGGADGGHVVCLLRHRPPCFDRGTRFVGNGLRRWGRWGGGGGARFAAGAGNPDLGMGWERVLLFDQWHGKVLVSQELLIVAQPALAAVAAR